MEVNHHKTIQLWHASINQYLFCTNMNSTKVNSSSQNQQINQPFESAYRTAANSIIMLYSNQEPILIKQERTI